MLSVIRPRTLPRFSPQTLTKRQFVDPGTAATIVTALGAPIAAIGATMWSRYYISKPHQLMAKTGLGIKDITISKNTFRWPFQQITTISLHPTTYDFHLTTMSLEKLEFVLPISVTIGPNPDETLCIEYVRRLEDIGEKFDKVIMGILEGEIRILASTMTVEDIFNKRDVFKTIILEKIQDEFDKVGLKVYAVNAKELADGRDSKYFSNLRQKKLSEAENSAKISIAEANKLGDIGHKENEVLARQQIAALEAETVQRENENRQKIAKSNADLVVVQQESLQREQVAAITSTMTAELKRNDMQKLLESQRMETETEKRRADEMSQTIVDAEKHIAEAEGIATAIKTKSDAELYDNKNKAEAINATFAAQAEGLEKLRVSLGSDSDTLIQYLMVDKNLYRDLADASAKAINGLKPKITVWNTGAESTNGMADIVKMIPPMASAVSDIIDRTKKR